MAGNISTYLRNKLLDQAFGGGDYARPATLYLALFTSRGTESQANANTNFVWVDTDEWTNYARKSITNNATNFPASIAAVKINGVTFAFAAATLHGVSSVPVAGCAFYDASVAGNLLGWFDLVVVKNVTNGGTFSINGGDLSIS